MNCLWPIVNVCKLSIFQPSNQHKHFYVNVGVILKIVLSVQKTAIN